MMPMPWRYSPINRDHHGEWGEVLDANGRAVCECIYAEHARLLIAAPDLLAALKDIAETVVHAPEGGHEEVADCVRIARAAIRKAEGN